MLNLDLIQENTKNLFKLSSQIKLFQEELENLLTEIDENISEYEKGRISKDIFEENEKKMKLKSAKLIKKINEIVDKEISLINKIGEETSKQKIEDIKKTKKIGKKNKKGK